MKTFTFNLSEGIIKNLSDLNETYIKIKHVSSTSFDNLEQQFTFKTSYPDGASLSKILSCGSYITPYTRDPEINIDYPVEDCQWTTIEAVKKDLQATYIFHYENLDDILNSSLEKESENKNKIKQEVDRWITNVNHLFTNIIEWLTPYEKNITINKGSTLLKEELAGTYPINVLDVTILNKATIHFVPIGTFILGGKGRIDLVTDIRQFDSYMLILQPINKIEKWFLIKNRDNYNKKEFTQSQLLILVENAIKTKNN